MKWNEKKNKIKITIIATTSNHNIKETNKIYYTIEDILAETHINIGQHQTKPYEMIAKNQDKFNWKKKNKIKK